MISFLGEIHKKYMKSSWNKICDLIPKGSSVLDIGCGRGEFLFYISDKLQYGKGIDISEKKILFANFELKKGKISNLEFVSCDASLLNESNRFDIGILSGILHTLDSSSQVSLFNNSRKMCKKTIILDYDVESFKSILNNPFIYMEEFLVGHYTNFRNYL